VHATIGCEPTERARANFSDRRGATLAFLVADLVAPIVCRAMQPTETSRSTSMACMRDCYARITRRNSAGRLPGGADCEGTMPAEVLISSGTMHEPTEARLVTAPRRQDVKRRRARGCEYPEREIAGRQDRVAG
jgi:hypothetical protein